MVTSAVTVSNIAATGGSFGTSWPYGSSSRFFSASSRVA